MTANDPRRSRAGLYRGAPAHRSCGRLSPGRSIRRVPRVVEVGHGHPYPPMKRREGDGMRAWRVCAAGALGALPLLFLAGPAGATIDGPCQAGGEIDGDLYNADEKEVEIPDTG